MKTTTISIVIPVFNVENVVSETLRSVKQQKLSPNEVIIIDDGSTDNSFDIINNFKNLSGWKILQTSNQGLGLTRNLGLSIAKSEYIYFLDSDDILKDNLIKDIKQAIEQYNKPDMILFSGECFHHNNSLIKKPNLEFTIKGQFFFNNQLISKLTRRKEIFPQVSRYITKRNLWSSNKLCYPKGIAEDEAVFFPLLSLSQNTIVIPKTYYKYRVGRPGSITSKSSKSENVKNYLDRIHFHINFMDLNFELIKSDLSAWRYILARKGLNYLSLCLKTKTKISWSTLSILILKSKNLSLPFKLIWRFLKNLFNKILK